MDAGGDFILGLVGGLWFTAIAGPIAIYILLILLLPFGGWKTIEMGWWSPIAVFKASCVLNTAIGIGYIVASFNEDLDPEARELFTRGRGVGYLAGVALVYTAYYALYEDT